MRLRKIAVGLVGMLAAAVLVVLAAASDEVAEVKPQEVVVMDESTSTWAPAVEPKPLTQSVTRGLKWLVDHQLPNGAWGQGEESKRMGGGAGLRDAPSVGDTCVAMLALIRSGSTPAEGLYAQPLAAGVAYVCNEIENADEQSMWITSTRGTRIQGKLGQNIDTFLACLVLSELKGRMGNQDDNARIEVALNKVLQKMNKGQNNDGTWGDRGWAPALAMGVASKAYNRAAQAGADSVDENVRRRTEDYNREQYDKDSGSFKADGSAGVDLYATGASVGGQRDSVNTNAEKAGEARERVENAATEEERTKARADLQRYEQAEADLRQAQQAVVKKLDDERFIAGFGSNGGEEFLSYMNIGESLVVTGGPEWQEWDRKMAENLGRVQNQDGSWSGHHCITGRTFCTSAALLVLMTDRAPVPIAARMSRQ